MKSAYITYHEHDNQLGTLEIEMCPVCKYVYKVFTPQDYYADKVILKGSIPFIEMLGHDLSKSSDYDERIKEHIKYACPKCGVIQIDVGDFKDEDEQN